jgi:hypothetical protein
MNTGTLFGALAISFGLATASAAQTNYTVQSQNTLHLGYSSTNATKIGALKAQFTGFDIILLQEVMRGAYVVDNGTTDIAQVIPAGNYTFRQTDLLGKSSYKETYVFIFNNATITADNQMFSAPAADFSRPPHAILIRTGTTWTWIVDFHAIWGQPQQRVTEAGNMNTFANALANTPVSGQRYTNCVIGGDWNLPADDAGFNALTGNGFTIEPTGLTSLNPAGNDSSSYDHFAYKVPAGTVTVTNAAVIAPASKATWRSTVSDHMGVSCTISFP